MKKEIARLNALGYEVQRSEYWFWAVRFKGEREWQVLHGSLKTFGRD